MSSWQEVKDDQGRTYYYNPDTQETSWEKPAAESTGTWQTYTTEDGKEYYYNKTTGVTTWDKPVDLVEKLENSVEVTNEKTETGTLKEDTSKSEMSDLDLKLASEPLLDSTLANTRALPDKEEAKKQFQEMLKDGNVDSTWSFEKVIKTFIKNKSYWAIGDAVERRTLYEDYLVSKLERESSSKTDLIEEFKKNFVREIQTYLDEGKISHQTRWISTKNLLIKDKNPVFEHSILPDAELERLFTECTEKLRLQEDEALQKKKDQALEELEGYLLQITAARESEDYSWSKLYDRLQTDARFIANKHFQVLTKRDILNLYSNKIYPKLIGKIWAEIKKTESANLRTDRQARDAFKALLSKQVISANTEFTHILPSIENEDEYIEICGRNGSTPLELFWDFTEEKRQQQKVKKDLIEYSVRTHIEQNPDGPDYETFIESFDAFFALLKRVKDESLTDLRLFSVQGSKELYMIHEILQNELKARKNQEQSVFERRLKGDVYDLANWIAKNRDLVDSSVILFEDKKPIEEKEGDQAVDEGEDKQDGPKRAIILVSDREAIVKSKDLDISAWQEKLANVEAFTRLANAITRFYDADPVKVEQSLRVNLLVCLNETCSLMTNTLHKKRSASDIFQHEVKRAKPDGEKKPILMNY